MVPGVCEGALMLFKGLQEFVDVLQELFTMVQGVLKSNEEMLGFMPGVLDWFRRLTGCSRSLCMGC